MKIFIYTLLIGVLGFNGLIAQNQETQRYLKEEIGTLPLSSKAWKNATGGKKYIKKYMAGHPQKKQQQQVVIQNGFRRIRTQDPIRLEDVLYWLMIGLVTIFCAGIIMRILLGDTQLANPNIRKKRQRISLEDIEQNLHEADVESFLKDALKKEDYKLSVRLYFLAIIKELSIKGQIEWKRDKTNGTYVRELRRKHYSKIKEFQRITYIYERVWYSSAAFTASEFELVRKEFKSLLNALN